MNKLNAPTARLPRTARWWIPAGLLALGACASTPPPVAELAVGGAAVERASGPAAAEAPVLLAAARDKMTKARAANAAEDYVLARQLAEQATADATLAEAQARSARSTRALAEVRAGLNQLRDEAVRK